MKRLSIQFNDDDVRRIEALGEVFRSPTFVDAVRSGLKFAAEELDLDGESDGNGTDDTNAHRPPPIRKSRVGV